MVWVHQFGEESFLDRSLAVRPKLNERDLFEPGIKYSICSRLL